MADSLDIRRLSPGVLWSLLLGSTGLLLGLALAPPVLPMPLRAMVMDAFSPVCHQLPGRSPHLGDLPIAVCDRCVGIYLGVVLGVAVVKRARPLWQWLGATRHYFLLASLAPLTVDWIGPILGLWSNGPSSRFATGLLFGLVAASFVADQLLRKVTRAKPTKGFDLT